MIIKMEGPQSKILLSKISKCILFFGRSNQHFIVKVPSLFKKDGLFGVSSQLLMIVIWMPIFG